MDFNRRHFLGAAGLGALCAAIPGMRGDQGAAAISSPSADLPPPAPPLATSAPAPAAAARPPLLDKALAALDRHRGRIARRDLVGLVDFSAHSSHRRFQLVDVASGEVVDTFLVAHGRGSDPGHTGFASTFSNVPGSNASSLGSYLVSDTYIGKHGHSRRLVGLDPENSLAFDRAIVIHGATYVAPSIVEAQGQIGRSLGCFTVSPGYIGEVLDRLGEGCLLYADLAHTA